MKTIRVRWDLFLEDDGPVVVAPDGVRLRGRRVLCAVCDAVRVFPPIVHADGAVETTPVPIQCPACEVESVELPARDALLDAGALSVRRVVAAARPRTIVLDADLAEELIDEAVAVALASPADVPLVPAPGRPLERELFPLARRELPLGDLLEPSAQTAAALVARNVALGFLRDVALAFPEAAARAAWRRGRGFDSRTRADVERVALWRSDAKALEDDALVVADLAREHGAAAAVAWGFGEPAGIDARAELLERLERALAELPPDAGAGLLVEWIVGRRFARPE